MRAMMVSENGGPGVLAVAELPDPEPGPGEVVIDVAASGVNFADIAKTGACPNRSHSSQAMKPRAPSARSGPR
jgi:NADPH2:quinone reductase